jgi:hypothetical protein
MEGLSGTVMGRQSRRACPERSRRGRNKQEPGTEVPGMLDKVSESRQGRHKILS